MLLLLGGCEPQVVQAVGDPGGAFHSGQGCNAAALEAGGRPGCPSGAQLRFDGPTDDAPVGIASGPLSGKQVSCRRSYCGSGALALHAEYTWRAGTTPAPGEKLGEIHYRLPRTTELYGRTLGHALFLDGPVTPVNAYLAIIDHDGRFRMVEDGPVAAFGRWTQRSGAIRIDNGALRLAPGTTSLLADEIVISVYLATDVRTGDSAHWSADFYVDELGW